MFNFVGPDGVHGVERAGGAPGARPGPAASYGTARGHRSAAGDAHGRSCDLVTVPTRQGLEAVDILRRCGAAAVGPVLHDGSCDTLGFLVPPGTADAWDVPGSACIRTLGRGTGPFAPPPVAGTGWLLPPGDGGRVTDPTVLRVALGAAARLIEVADNCH
ncbi:hypothetical protein [Streptomyces odontomachi]|uniref:hypothetical protein n=1 Tax=Streptomyces odontomachi TaxID=2944940 RepID=UPI0021090A65|nr:hypothetical protein [Streptomyces sp. ODS25]